MVHRTYYGLGPGDAAVGEFEALTPYVAELTALRRACTPRDLDDKALGIALDGLETAAYHFTRRRDFYRAVADRGPRPGDGNGRLSDREEAIAAFDGLSPYARQLRGLMFRCRPFGRDYLALDIALKSLETAAFHFTRIEAFYGLKGDGAGTMRREG
jgi:hypothetical protein